MQDLTGYTLDFKQSTDLPVGLCDAQAAFLNNKLYVGGGKDLNIYVCDFSASTRPWTHIVSKAEYSAITVYRSQLVVVGGRLPDVNIITSQLWVLQGDTLDVQTISAMKTARLAASAVSHDRYLIVVGGELGASMVLSVEIYDGASKEWFQTAPLPSGSCYIKSTLSRGVVYLTGGWSQQKSVYYASVRSLLAAIRQVPQAQSNPTVPVDYGVWQTLAKLTYPLCSCAVFQKTLIAVGGRDTGVDSGATASSSPIHMYSSSIKQWVKVGEMPLSIDKTCTVVSTSGDLIVVGGRTSHTNASKAVYVHSIPRYLQGSVQ